MLARMLGAARLDSHTYEDVERDRGATLQALAIVIMVTIASLVGEMLAGLLNGEEIELVRSVVAGVILGVIGWALWALVTYIIGTTICKTPETEANWGQLARCTGFAQTPGLFNALSFIPVAGGLIVLVAFVWSVAAMVVGVRQALDYTSTLRAFFVVIVSAIPWVVLYVIVLIITGGVLGSE